ncbi:MAG: hypothetical protein IKC69_03045 [Clostridia bacterium]|nr:hypothetical protein [Clostridia bacterium]MBR2615636.1 hypothetical protein [Clostridia bacterium]
MKAKRALCFLCVCIIAIALMGCSPSEPSVKEITPESKIAETNPSEKNEYETQPLQEVSSQSYGGEDSSTNYSFFDTFKVVCEEHRNYKLLTNADVTGYCYYVYDNAGELLDSGYHDFRGCSFSFKDGYLSYHDAGLTFVWYERYYDVENGRVSRFYYRPLDTHKNLVAYYGHNSDDEIVLVVSDMFDKQTYYCEFTREFSVSVLTGGSTGSFSEDGKNLTVTYFVTDQENQTDTEVTETFRLRS